MVRSLILAGSLLTLSCVGSVGGEGGGTETPPNTDAGASDAGPDATRTRTPPEVPWEPLGGEVYVPRVKNLLTGLSATSAEIATGSTGTEELKGLIDMWIETPQFDAKMLAFFRNAFQQGQLKKGDLENQLAYGGGNSAFANNAAVEQRFYRDLQEMFPRTALALMDQGRPFNETITTRGFMMTVPLMSFFLHAEGVHVPDVTNDINSSNNTYLFHEANPAFTFSVHGASGPIPLTETLNPASPNYMRWYAPEHVVGQGNPACDVDPQVYPAGGPRQARHGEYLLDLIFGRIVPYPAPDGTDCNPLVREPLFSEQDFNTWRWIDVREPDAGEETTLFYDLLNLRETTEIVMRTPRVGFFTTHAFFANWPTNESNQARVTMNQTLIVALGKSFDPSNITVPISEVALNGEHAEEGSACYECHRTLDPMRQFFRQAYSLHYHQQFEEPHMSEHGVFAFDGMTAQGTGIGDLAQMLSDHPRYPVAWTQKLCYFARSAACREDDPEFIRVAEAFRDSDYDFKTLVREFFSSPLVTEASDTETFQRDGVVTPIALRLQVCQALEARLELPDVCGVSSIAPSGEQRRARNLVEAIPASGYSRGSEVPATSVDPSLFLRAGVEALCSEVAAQVVDAGEGSRYDSASPDAAIDDMLAVVMNLHAPDPRALASRTVLREHFDAVAEENTANQALTSTFILACLAPSSVAMGM